MKEFQLDPQKVIAIMEKMFPAQLQIAVLTARVEELEADNEALPALEEALSKASSAPGTSVS